MSVAHVHVPNDLYLQFFGNLVSDLFHGHVHSSHAEYHAKRVTTHEQSIVTRFQRGSRNVTSNLLIFMMKCLNASVCATMFCVKWQPQYFSAWNFPCRNSSSVKCICNIILCVGVCIVMLDFLCFVAVLLHFGVIVLAFSSLLVFCW